MKSGRVAPPRFALRGGGDDKKKLGEGAQVVESIYEDVS